MATGLMVEIGANTARLVQDMAKARGTIENFATGAKRAFAGLITTAALTGLATFVKSSLEAADALVETAEKVGIAASSLKLYQVIAQQSGTDISTLATGIGILSKHMAGLDKESSAAQKALSGMGVEVKNADGSIKQTESVIEDIAEQFSKMQDGAGKTATAMVLFGKAGKELVPFLNLGKEGFADMRKELEELGFVFDDVALERAAALNDRLDLLTAANKNFTSEIVMGMVPALNDIVKGFTGVGNSADTAREIGESFGEVLKSTAIEAIALAGALDVAATGLSGYSLKMQQLSKKYQEWPAKMREWVKTGINPFSSETVDVSKSMGESWAKYKAMIDKIKAGSTSPARKNRTGAAPDISTESTKAANAAKESADKIQQVIEALQHEYDALWQTNEQQHLYNALKHAGVDANTLEGQQIAGIVHAIEAEKQAREDATDAARWAVEIERGLQEERRDAMQTAENLAAVERDIADQRLRYTDQLITIEERYGKLTTGQAAQARINIDLERLNIEKEYLDKVIEERNLTAQSGEEQQGVLALLLQRKALEEEIVMVQQVGLGIMREYSDDFGSGYLSGLQQWVSQMATGWQQGEEIAKSSLDEIKGLFSDTFMLFIKGDLDQFQNLFESFCDSLTRKFVDMLADMAMEAALKGLLGMFTGGGGQNMALGNSVDMFSFHKGGRVPYDGIPRLHKGLAADEYPAILQAGETVIPKGGSTSPSVNVIINNNTSAQATTKETRSADGGLNIEVLIDEAIGNSIMQQRGRTYGAIKSAFGARPIVAGR